MCFVHRLVAGELCTQADPADEEVLHPHADKGPVGEVNEDVVFPLVFLPVARKRLTGEVDREYVRVNGERVAVGHDVLLT